MLIERLHRRFLDVIKAEFDPLGNEDINNVHTLILLNNKEEQLTQGELTELAHVAGVPRVVLVRDASGARILRNRARRNPVAATGPAPSRPRRRPARYSRPAPSSCGCACRSLANAGGTCADTGRRAGLVEREASHDDSVTV